MAWYRFSEPTRQTNYIDFGLEIGVVCGHLKTIPDAGQPRGHVEVLEIRVRSNKLTFDTSLALSPALLLHLGLEAG